MQKLKFIFLSILCLSAAYGQAQDDSSMISNEQLQELIFTDSILKSFHYRSGSIQVGQNLATINVPQGCLFLETAEARYLMENIYGNEANPELLGVLLSDTPNVMTGCRWLVTYNYENSGHVKDDDAEDINYDDLLKGMKEDITAQSEERVKLGLGSVKLIGWAQKPFYDTKTKKLHWAKELNFDNSPSNTLNYDIRLLGRQGILSMNIISDMESLKEVNADVNKIMASTNFNKGNTYADFNEDTDKMAEYGIAGLIAGGILAKAGFFAKIGLFLLKFIKIIGIGVIALGGFLFNRFKRKKNEEEPAVQTISNEENKNNSNSDNQDQQQ